MKHLFGVLFFLALAVMLDAAVITIGPGDVRAPGVTLTGNDRLEMTGGTIGSLNHAIFGPRVRLPFTLGTSDVETRDESHASISGGFLRWAHGTGNSTIEISGGQLLGPLLYENSTLVFSGGTAIKAEMYDTSTFIMTGGTILGSVGGGAKIVIYDGVVGGEPGFNAGIQSGSSVELWTPNVGAPVDLFGSGSLDVFALDFGDLAPGTYSAADLDIGYNELLTLDVTWRKYGRGPLMVEGLREFHPWTGTITLHQIPVASATLLLGLSLGCLGLRRCRN